MKYIKFALRVWVMLSLFYMPAILQASEVTTALDSAKAPVIDTLNGVLKIVLVIGGFGLIGFAFLSFTGKLNWKWFAALAVGVAILAATKWIINTVVGTTNQSVGSGLTLDKPF